MMASTRSILCRISSKVKFWNEMSVPTSRGEQQYIRWELGGRPGRRLVSSSFKSNLSVIAASAKLIVFIGVVAILYFGRPVFVPLAVAILLAFILSPLVRVLRRWRFGRIPSIITVVLLAFLIICGLRMLLGEQVTHLAAALPKYHAENRCAAWCDSR